MTGTSTPPTVVRLLSFATCLWFAVCSTGAGKAHADERFNGAVIPITVGDPSCGPSALYNRTIDYSRYEYGCSQIEARQYIAGVSAARLYVHCTLLSPTKLEAMLGQHDHMTRRENIPPLSRREKEMMMGPKHYIAGGNSRDVFLVDHEGHKLVLKTTKHESAHLSTRHAMEAIALDVVSTGVGHRFKLPYVGIQQLGMTKCTVDQFYAGVMGAPNIAPTLGVCGTASVQPFFAGGTVEGLIFEGAWTGVPIEMPVVLQMSLDAMRGLQVLHEAPGGPIIHNAIRPEQLLRYANGAKKLPACAEVVILWLGSVVLGRDRHRRLE
ncbi:unnamed protein product [Ectocarpus sp. CCAP 1310/34]|nr:unnamed protein product [Ectocarpus sp. CCAP 1310/34]